MLSQEISALASDLRASSYGRQEGFEYLGITVGYISRISELTCNVSIADCIKEVAEHRVRLRMHVGNRRSLCKD